MGEQPTGREPPWRNGDDQNLLRRTTTDGHRLEFGLRAGLGAPAHRLGHAGRAAAAHGAGLPLRAAPARRSTTSAPAPSALARRVRPAIPCATHRHDELGQLAATINTMGEDIHQMLEAKRALLLAPSHELRSPLTRARLNAELLPDTAEAQAPRQALLRDLGEMARVITDLLESERLAAPPLHREDVDLVELARG